MRQKFEEAVMVAPSWSLSPELAEAGVKTVLTVSALIGAIGLGHYLTVKGVSDAQTDLTDEFTLRMENWADRFKKEAMKQGLTTGMGALLSLEEVQEKVAKQLCRYKVKTEEGLGLVKSVLFFDEVAIELSRGKRLIVNLFKEGDEEAVFIPILLASKVQEYLIMSILTGRLNRPDVQERRAMIKDGKGLLALGEALYGEYLDSQYSALEYLKDNAVEGVIPGVTVEYSRGNHACVVTAPHFPSELFTEKQLQAVYRSGWASFNACIRGKRDATLPESQTKLRALQIKEISSAHTTTKEEFEMLYKLMKEIADLTLEGKYEERRRRLKDPSIPDHIRGVLKFNFKHMDYDI